MSHHWTQEIRRPGRRHLHSDPCILGARTPPAALRNHGQLLVRFLQPPLNGSAEWVTPAGVYLCFRHLGASLHSAASWQINGWFDTNLSLYSRSLAALLTGRAFLWIYGKKRPSSSLGSLERDNSLLSFNFPFYLITHEND